MATDTLRVLKLIVVRFIRLVNNSLCGGGQALPVTNKNKEDC